MRETLILWIKEMGIVFLCAIMGVAALVVTYFISNDCMREHVWESAIILHSEGLGAYLWQDVEETKLDIYTDGLMINVSYTETEDGVRDILLGTHVEVDGRNPMDSLYEVAVLANDNYTVKNYGRYWHGYQVLLRPLLCFFNYSDILQINMILQLLLVFGFVTLLAGTEERVYIVPFLGMYVFLCPVSLAGSLQYSPCFYIMMSTLTALFIWRGRLTDTGKNIQFLLAGVLTAYFDFLTYPFITLGVPLIACLAFDLRRWSADRKHMWKNILLYTVSWGIGYVGMWSSKWVIASVFTGENIIYDAFGAIAYRSGYFTEKHSYYDTLKLNLGVCNRKVILLALICVSVCVATFRIKKHIRIERRLFSALGAILFVSLYPFFWYLFTKDHSCCHSYFTWRELGISVFGVLTAGVMGIRAFGEKGAGQQRYNGKLF
ncbi:MAG: hypothetical protein K1W31_18410 [Lachnospiraceae bacterium]